MNLKAFHIVFVIAASLVSFVFGGWAWRFAEANDSGLYQAASIASFAAGVALIAYGIWFWRKISRRIVVAALVLFSWLATPSVVEACTVCYGEAEGPMIDAARGGVFVLFGLVALVQIAFIGFFVCLRRRARLYEGTNAVISEELPEP